jgi:hypothetical protein
LAVARGQAGEELALLLRAVRGEVLVDVVANRHSSRALARW